MKILVLPDAQVKENVPLDHLECAGRFAAAKKPDVIVNIGDFADMPSLSSYDLGKKTFEGRRYKKDIAAARTGMELFLGPILEEQARLRKNKEKIWKPRLIFCTGNHEFRIIKAVESDAKLEGVLSIKDLGYEDYGWEVYPFLEPVIVEGVAFNHYFPSGQLGRPTTSARAILSKMHMSCVAGHQQGRDIAFGKRADGTEITAIIAGCLTPDHKVLTSDLRYIPIGNLKIGDTVVSFDEVAAKRKRRFRTGTVLAIQRDIDEVYQVKLESGKRFKVTKDHQWFVKTGSIYRWTTTDKLRQGTYIPRFFDEWDTLQTFDAGWLSGMYDGEGSLYARQTTGGACMQLSISQKNGPTLEKLRFLLEKVCGKLSSNWETRNDVQQLRIQGGTTHIAKVLGQLRPQRLLSKFKPEYLGSISSPDSMDDKVESIVYIGKSEIIRSKIDTGTYIVEGYPHHNSFYQHAEEYLSPMTNKHWRGVVMCHQVHEGSFDEMMVSLEFLKNKYGAPVVTN